MKKTLVICAVMVMLFATAAYAATITGTNHSDVLDGTGRGDHINALQGNDRINGRAGFDYIDGGQGTDVCYGGQETKKQKQRWPNRQDQFANCETTFQR